MRPLNSSLSKVQQMGVGGNWPSTNYNTIYPILDNDIALRVGRAPRLSSNSSLALLSRNRLLLCGRRLMGRFLGRQPRVSQGNRASSALVNSIETAMTIKGVRQTGGKSESRSKLW